MPLSPADRQTFSLKIVSSDVEIKGLDAAKAQLQKEIDKAQALDDANKHLADPVTAIINQYQLEFNAIDGNVRSTFVEQDIQDSANKKLGNFFFPNNVQLTIPSLAGTNNIWTKVKPFALAYGIGKNYGEGYGSGPSELQLITDALALIASAGSYTNIQLTSGQHCVETGTCSIPTYTTETDCLAHSGVWTPGPDDIEDFADIHTLKTNLMNKVVAIANQAIAETAAINANPDKDAGRVAQNTTAKNNVNVTFIPAVNTWLGYADFNTAHGQTTCAGFNSYNADLLAPTKLHSTELAALQAALTARQTFLATRVSQLSTNLGTITQDLTTGDLTGGTGLYRTRFNFLILRLNAMSGSATKLSGLKVASGAQDTIKSSTLEAKAIYMSILPTSALTQNGSDTATIFLKDASLYAQGDTIYIMAEGQQELLRAIKSISGNAVVLNDIIPSKYRTVDSLRAYKDLT